MIIEQVEALRGTGPGLRQNVDEGPARVGEVDWTRGQAGNRILQPHLSMEVPRVRFADRVG